MLPVTTVTPEAPMPTPAEKRKHKGVAKVRTKKLRDGTLVRIYFYNDGKSYADTTPRGKQPYQKPPGKKVARGKAQRSRAKGTR